MKFLLDHDVPAEIAHLLRYWEHNVTVLRTVLPVTASEVLLWDAPIREPALAHALRFWHAWRERLARPDQGRL